MWIVVKYKKKDLNFLKSNLKREFDSKIQFYSPKIIFKKIIRNSEKTFEQNVLYNYMFCFSEKFEDFKNLLKIQYIKGLDYYLIGHVNNQVEILIFMLMLAILMDL